MGLQISIVDCRFSYFKTAGCSLNTITMSQIGSLSRLESLNLSLCTVASSDLLTFLPRLSILKTLHLSGIRKLASSDFSHLSSSLSIESLSLQNCPLIEGLDALEMPNYHLSVLDISWNNQIDLSNFTQLRSLQVLKANGLFLLRPDAIKEPLKYQPLLPLCTLPLRELYLFRAENLTSSILSPLSSLKTLELIDLRKTGLLCCPFHVKRAILTEKQSTLITYGKITIETSLV